MLNQAERTRRAREIREQLRLYLVRTHNRNEKAAHVLPPELVEAQKQLDLLVKLETPDQQGKKAS